MLHWLVRLWRKLEARFHGQAKPSSSTPSYKVYYPSNLHGRHR
mgnify:CR=1